MNKLRVLVVDDSAFMRSAVARLIESDPRFEVVGQARDGAEALGLARERRPDLVTLDFNMPGMDGAATARALLAERPVPIVMLSAHTSEGAEATLWALAAGAVDFVTKPSGEVSASLASVREELLSKLMLAAGANLGVAPAAAPVSARSRGSAATAPVARPIPPGSRIIALAASTGGPAALARLAPELGRLREAAIVIVQHLPPGFTAALAEQLARAAGVVVREARAGDRLSAGQVLVAPGGHHLVVERSGALALSDEPPVHGVKPAADVTLRALATVYGARVAAVVLTGMGRDGALGAAAVRAAGGRVIAQDRASSVVYGMPKAAAELGVVDEVAPLDRVGAALTRWVNG